MRNMSLDGPAEMFAVEESYRPLSPAAVLGTVAGLIALLCAALVNDFGAIASGLASAIALAISVRGVGSVRRYDMAGLGAARAGVGLSIASIVLGSGISVYTSLYEVPEGYLPIGYDLLQADATGPIPATAQKLDGQKVYIKGYMYPSSQTSGIKEFVLCRDNGTCCFGGQPKMNDMVQVRLKEPLTLDYHTGVRQVAGVFRAKADNSADGLGTILYHLEADFAR